MATAKRRRKDATDPPGKRLWYISVAVCSVLFSVPVESSEKRGVEDDPPVRNKQPLRRNPYAPCPQGLKANQKSKTPPSLVGEELTYKLSIKGLHIGKLETRVGSPKSFNNEIVLPFFGKAATSSFLASVVPFEGRYMTMVNPETFAPIGLRTELTYGKDKRWERARFSNQGRSLDVDYRLKGQEKRRSYRNMEHELTDVLSMMYETRLYVFEVGKKVCQDVFGSRRVWRMDAEVLGTSKIDTPSGPKLSYHVRARFDRRPVRGLSNTKRPKMIVEAFYSADDYKVPLRFHVTTDKVSSEGTLVSWKTGKPITTAKLMSLPDHR